VALDMRNQFDEVEALKHIDVSNPAMLCDRERWLLSNPMGIGLRGRFMQNLKVQKSLEDCTRNRFE